MDARVHAVSSEDGLAGGGNYASLTLMTHETAHMWTGNIVTCQWWDVTWLNEGITSFFEYYAADWVYILVHTLLM